MRILKILIGLLIVFTTTSQAQTNSVTQYKKVQKERKFYVFEKSQTKVKVRASKNAKRQYKKMIKDEDLFIDNRRKN